MTLIILVSGTSYHSSVKEVVLYEKLTLSYSQFSLCFYFKLFSHEVRKSAFDLVESTTELFNVLIAKYGNTSDVS